MYGGVFTVGVAVTRSTLTLTLADVRSYVIVSSDAPYIARCLTGLGPSSNNNGANALLGGFYFNSNMIPNSGESASCSSDKIQVRPGADTAGVINIHRCQALGTAEEGIYTCTMMNSSMMDQSVRFHIYLNGRSEFILINITYPAFISLHSCSSDRHSIIIQCNSQCWFFPHIILYITKFSSRHIHMEEG